MGGGYTWPYLWYRVAALQDRMVKPSRFAWRLWERPPRPWSNKGLYVDYALVQ
jgi:hypothetical protein